MFKGSEGRMRPSIPSTEIVPVLSSTLEMRAVFQAGGEALTG
jgi:hypothetical protein